MKYLNYKVVNEETGEILTTDGLQLVILSVAARDIIEEQVKLDKQPNNRFVVSYADTTLAIAKKILKAEHFADQQSKTSLILSKISTAVEESKAVVTKNREAGKYKSFEDELNDFLFMTTTALTNKIEVIKDEYVQADDGSGALEHHAVIRIEHDNEWVFDIKNGSEIEVNPHEAYEIKINGLKFSNLGESKEITHDARWHSFLFNPLAMQMADEMQTAQEINALLGDPDIVLKSKGIAKIIGGNYENYLTLVAKFNKELNSGKINKENLHDEDFIKSLIEEMATSGFLKEEQTKQIIELFKAKPIYH